LIKYHKFRINISNLLNYNKNKTTQINLKLLKIHEMIIHKIYLIHKINLKYALIKKKMLNKIKIVFKKIKISNNKNNKNKKIIIK
jgi:hypothetical protein